MLALSFTGSKLDSKPSHAHANKITPTNTSLKREYPRNAKFDTLVKKYDSPETKESIDDHKTAHPKCKISLSSRLVGSNDYVKSDALDIYHGIPSSRSSLYSIPSIEWDGRKAEFLFKTRSLPRPGKKCSLGHLFRTQSHAGFINSHLKDPEPVHFHLPRCRSCGSTNSSYVWELSRDKSEKNCFRKGQDSIYESIDNVAQKCIEDADKTITPDCELVRVEAKEVPVCKVKVLNEEETEFVDCQEFNEDCYLGDIVNSTSSENLTVIEKTPPAVSYASEEESTVKNSCRDEFFDEVVKELNSQLLKEEGNVEANADECAVEGDPDNEVYVSVENSEGEYLNFSAEMDFDQAVYESPVKDLVGKDIRDYSVPINFYCEDYNSGKSPKKRRESAKSIVLEPILEESKSSCGDESSNITAINNKDNLSVTTQGNHSDGTSKHNESFADMKSDLNDQMTVAAVFLDDLINDIAMEIGFEEETQERGDTVNTIECQKDEKVMEQINEHKEILAAGDHCLEKDKATTKVVTVVPPGNGIRAINEEVNENKIAVGKISITSDYSIASTVIETPSFNSTVEFEKYEAVSEIIGIILNKFLLATETFDLDFSDELHTIAQDRNVKLFDNSSKVESYNKNTDVIDGSPDNCQDKVDVENLSDVNETEAEENFSIALLIQVIEEQEELMKKETTSVSMHDSLLTDNSDLDPKRQPEKVIEGIIQQLLELTYATVSDNMKVDSDRKVKKVVTVVDAEDILFTAKPLWDSNSIEPMNTVVFSTDIALEAILHAEKLFTPDIDRCELVDEIISFEPNIAQEDLFKNAIDFVPPSPELISTLFRLAADSEDKETIPSIDGMPETIKAVISTVLDDDDDILLVGDSVTVEHDVIACENNDEPPKYVLCSNKQKSLDHIITEMQAKETNQDENYEMAYNLIKSLLDALLDNFLESSNVTNFEYCEDDVETGDVFNDSFIAYNKSYTISYEQFQIYNDVDNDDSISLAEEIINKALDDSLAIHESIVEDEQLRTKAGYVHRDSNIHNRTFVLKNDNEEIQAVEEMNMAFVADVSFVNVNNFSSPVRENSVVFDVCDESPIRNTDATFIGDDLSVLYEKDDTILGSPFVKKAPVISMSHSFHSGGIKYWVSFDSNLNEDKPLKGFKRQTENATPSFISINLNNEKQENEFKECINDTDSPKYWDKDQKAVKRKSVFCEELSDSFATACASKTESFDTCESAEFRTPVNEKKQPLRVVEETDTPQKKLLYGNKLERLSSGARNRRQYYSWPPFEESLFYKIISKFRMSESFDPSDFENYESSL